MSSFLSRGLIPKKYELFLLHTRELEQSGFIVLYPVFILTFISKDNHKTEFFVFDIRLVKCFMW